MFTRSTDAATWVPLLAALLVALATWAVSEPAAATLAAVAGFGLMARLPGFPVDLPRPKSRTPDSDRELDRMRRYVPGPIAEQIANGASLEYGESEVTVMFVDLRGYTAFAESLTPAQVFEFLNRYTQTVSRIVRRHGGFVVEFNGDGMMAVFGAPLSLAHKERQAVAAACEISYAVGALGPGPSASPAERSHAGDGSNGTLRSHRVGVGVATGPAFVGNIRAVDRTIWSAVGTTTNRASRLQALTRDLGAQVAVDGATHHAAGSPPGFARREPVAVTGLSAPVEVYVLARP